MEFGDATDWNGYGGMKRLADIDIGESGDRVAGRHEVVMLVKGARTAGGTGDGNWGGGGDDEAPEERGRTWT